MHLTKNEMQIKEKTRKQEDNHGRSIQGIYRCTDTDAELWSTGEEKPEPVAVKEEPVQPQLDESMLSDEERRMVDEFSRQIDIHNTNGILQYGVGTQKKMADFSETALKNVKTKDLAKSGVVISGLCGYRS